MGLCVTSQKEIKNQPQKVAKSQLQNVDVVKVKLKQARDTINMLMRRKEKDLEEIDKKIKEQVPKYQETGNKKALVPLLQAKKEIQTMIDNIDVRARLVNQKLNQVQLQQMDMETVKVLDESNKFVKELQDEMEKKDWRGILQQSENKYNLDWPQREDIEEDPIFQGLWKELGGDKIPNNKKPAQKQVNVNVTQQKQKQENKQQNKQMIA